MGIAARTFYSWLEKGTKGISPYAAFARAVRRAVAEAVCNLTAKALAGGPGSAQALMILERRFPREYGRRIPISKTREDVQRRIEADRRASETTRMCPEAQRKLDEAIALAMSTLSDEARSKIAGPLGRPAGRGQKLTPAVQEGILAALRIAVPAKYAAEKEGIDESTFYEWLAKGDQRIARYADFALAVRSATAEGVRNLTMRALGGGAGATEALLLLERRFPEEYGQRLSIDQPSDADTIGRENALRLAEAVGSNPKALRLMHEAAAIEIANSSASRASVDHESGT